MQQSNYSLKVIRRVAAIVVSCLDSRSLQQYCLSWNSIDKKILYLYDIHKIVRIFQWQNPIMISWTVENCQAKQRFSTKWFCKLYSFIWWCQEPESYYELNSELCWVLILKFLILQSSTYFSILIHSQV